MPRLALALFAVAAIAPAAPVPKEKKAAEPYPFAVGTKWEYVRDGDETTVGVEEITKSEEKDGVRTIRAKVQEPGQKGFHVDYELKDGELRVVASSDVGKIDGQLVVWKAGMKAGDTWTNKFTLGEIIEEVVSVGKQEEITTPFGKLNAVPVTFTPTAPRGRPAYTIWYADGIGDVRHTTDGQKKPRKELKAFTPGKDK
jgi:hypothetical protein